MTITFKPVGVIDFESAVPTITFKIVGVIDFEVVCP